MLLCLKSLDCAVPVAAWRLSALNSILSRNAGGPVISDGCSFAVGPTGVERWEPYHVDEAVESTAETETIVGQITKPKLSRHHTMPLNINNICLILGKHIMYRR